MDALTKAAIDAAFTESLTRLLVTHNTNAMTGSVAPNERVRIGACYGKLKAERDAITAIFAGYCPKPEL